jgi:hypothetical protein
VPRLGSNDCRTRLRRLLPHLLLAITAVLVALPLMACITAWSFAAAQVDSCALRRRLRRAGRVVDWHEAHALLCAGHGTLLVEWWGAGRAWWIDQDLSRDATCILLTCQDREAGHAASLPALEAQRLSWCHQQLAPLAAQARLVRRFPRAGCQHHEVLAVGGRVRLVPSGELSATCLIREPNSATIAQVFDSIAPAPGLATER